LFERFDELRARPGLRRAIDFFGYAYLAVWNHLLRYIPSYVLRRFFARHLFGLKMGDSNLHRGVFLLSPWNIRVGDNVNIQMDCFLDGRGGLDIGDNVDLTPGVRILTEQHDIDSPGYDVVKKSVVIRDNVVVGSWALILPGVTIEEGAVIGAGSVVVHDVEPYVLAAGNPAVTKRERSRSLAYRLDYRRPFH